MCFERVQTEPINEVIYKTLNLQTQAYCYHCFKDKPSGSLFEAHNLIKIMKSTQTPDFNTSFWAVTNFRNTFLWSNYSNQGENI